MQMKKKFIFLIFFLSACSQSAELKMYRSFLNENGNDYARVGEAYKKLSDTEKISIYLGASKVHPSDAWVMDLAYEQNPHFLQKLRAVVRKKDDYVIAFNFVVGVQDAARKGNLSAADLTSLKLKELCHSLSHQKDKCLGFIEP